MSWVEEFVHTIFMTAVILFMVYEIVTGRHAPCELCEKHQNLAALELRVELERHRVLQLTAAEAHASVDPVDPVAVAEKVEIICSNACVMRAHAQSTRASIGQS
jgi:hypothetical protein